jgi:hypothetical protein
MKPTFYPSAHALPLGWVDAIWRASKAGAISWDEAEYLQTLGAPRCLKHNLPIKVLDDGGQCLRCIEEQYGAGAE